MKHMAYLETHILGDPTFHCAGRADQRLKINTAIQLYLSDLHSERVGYRLRTSLSFMEPALVKQEIDRQIRQNTGLSNAKLLADKLDQIVLSGEKTTQALTKKILDKEKRKRIVSMISYHASVPLSPHVAGAD